MTVEEVNPFSKIFQTGVVGAAIGALGAANLTYPKTPFVTQTTLAQFYRNTNATFASSITAGALLGVSFSAGKHFSKSIRGQDDFWNDVFGSLTAAVSAGIYKQNLRLTVGAALLFAPVAFTVKRINYEIQESSELNQKRINKEARSNLFLQTKIKELDTEDEALDASL